MQETYISDLGAYLKLIKELGEAHRSHGMLNSPVVKKFIFRGLSDSSFKLLPSVLRNTSESFGGKEIINPTYTTYHDELDILKAFRGEAMAYIKDVPIAEYLTWAEYAQHYGAPTRLLDWTENPLVALYFACKNNDDKNASLWVLHFHNYKDFILDTYPESELSDKTTGENINALIMGNSQIQYPIICTPYYIDLRMSAQSSVFMAWGNKNEAFEDMFTEKNYLIPSNRSDELPALSDASGAKVRSDSTSQFDQFLFKISVHADRKQSLLRELDSAGINEKSLFPGLDGVGRYMERKFRFNSNESVENW